MPRAAAGAQDRRGAGGAALNKYRRRGGVHHGSRGGDSDQTTRRGEARRTSLPTDGGRQAGAGDLPAQPRLVAHQRHPTAGARHRRSGVRGLLRRADSILPGSGQLAPGRRSQAARGSPGPRGYTATQPEQSAPRCAHRTRRAVARPVGRAAGRGVVTVCVYVHGRAVDSMTRSTLSTRSDQAHRRCLRGRDCMRCAEHG